LHASGKDGFSMMYRLKENGQLQGGRTMLAEP